MQIQNSLQMKKFVTSACIEDVVKTISDVYLQQVIRQIAIPRHYIAEKANNERVAQWIRQELLSYGYQVSLQGRFQNIVALPTGQITSPVLLAAAHYDTVPCSPGADDNGSGIAVLLACAQSLSGCFSATSTIFVIFNREEDCMLGSLEFVREFLPQTEITIAEAHIMEMVGYCSHDAGSQRLPAGFPIALPDRGDFLGLVGNQQSRGLVESVLRTAATYLDGFPVLGLKTYFGLEKYFPHLQRSDHAPFWQARIPAIMWTDTAEFRNRNYHSPWDTPETLDYEFMKHVAQLLLCKILTHEERIKKGRDA